MPTVQKIPSPFARRRFMPSSTKVGPAPAGRSVAGLRPFAGFRAPKRIIRYAYYAFVVSLPFEMADVEVAGGLLTLSKFLGYLFVILTLLQPSLCFKKPPKAVWYFVAYLVICIAVFFLLQAQPGDEVLKSFLSTFFSRVQKLVLFWISYNLMREENVVKGTLLSLSISVVALTLLQLAGLAGEAVKDRSTVFDANPNGVAVVLSIGLLALFGLAYGRQIADWKIRLTFWAMSALIGLSIVRTGSRGAIIALALSFGILIFKPGAIKIKFKMAVFGLAAVILLGIFSYQVDSVRKRWEDTLIEGKVAGRDVIYTEALGMFLERPIFGWGPVTHFWELGSRVGRPARDPHNTYLWMLTEVGLIGSIPFFVGLWLCWHEAWKARFSIQGIAPVMMVSFALMINMKGSWHNAKLFWLVLAYALASSAYATSVERWPNISFAAAGRRRNIAYQQARSRMARQLPASLKPRS
jgi:O-antigen ligase